jgi:hypothetical protein
VSICYLYKYGRLNSHSEALFSTAEVWFASPSHLNDPFECRPWFSFNGTSVDVAEALAKILRRKNPYLTPESAMALAVSIVLEGRHKDPKTWERHRNEVIAMLGQHIGLFCMSEKRDSILMWSHYGNDHQGYCLEFEAKDTTPVFGAAQQVIYSGDYPQIDFFSTPNNEQVDKIFLTKYSDWSYEREWRIVKHEKGPGSHPYPPEMLTGIIFGIRMPDADKARIRIWAAQRGAPVKFYQAARSEDSFRVDVSEVP